MSFITRRVFIFALLVFILNPTISKAQEANKQITIVAFGNSTTAKRNRVDSVYADRLPDLLKASGITCKVINSGIGGSHTGKLEDNNKHNS